MFDLERAIHRRNAATGSLAVKLSARMIESAPEELRAVLMVKHQELAGRTMASWMASKETNNG